MEPDVQQAQVNKYILLALIVFTVLTCVLGMLIAYNWSEIVFLYFGVVPTHH
jgi:hypothetical protein